jgi:hypothetical protein
MIFDVDKAKTLHTQIRVDNIQEEFINWIFRIIIEGVEYGFRGVLLEDGRVRFEIPPLSQVVKDIDVSGEYKVKIDAIADERFYQKAWESTATIKAMPRLEMAEVREEDNLEEVKGSGVSVLKIEDTDAEEIVQRFKHAKEEVLKEKKVKEEPKEKKVTSEKFSKFIRGEKELTPEEKLRNLLGNTGEKNDDSRED